MINQSRFNITFYFDKNFFNYILISQLIAYFCKIKNMKHKKKMKVMKIM